MAIRPVNDGLIESLSRSPRAPTVSLVSSRSIRTHVGILLVHHRDKWLSCSMRTIFEAETGHSSLEIGDRQRFRL